MIEPCLVLFGGRRLMAHRILVGASANTSMQALTDQTKGDKTDLSIVEAIVLALDAVSQSSPSAAPNDMPCLAALARSLAGSNSTSKGSRTLI